MDKTYDGYGRGARGGACSRDCAVRVKSQDKCSAIYDIYGHGVRAGVWSRGSFMMGVRLMTSVSVD